MSVRKEGDQHEVVVDLDDWADLADRKIKAAQAAGHFDNLPGLGKPLQLYENPHEGEWALAHRILRNADISPPWIGLQQQVQRRSDALRAGLAQIGRQLHDRRQRLLTLPYSERALAAKRLRGDSATARTRYLREAAALDRLLTSYNAALPRHLFWLQKPRLTPKRAAATSTRPARHSPVCSNTAVAGAPRSVQPLRPPESDGASTAQEETPVGRVTMRARARRGRANHRR